MRAVARRALLRTERDALAFSFGYKCASCSSMLQPGWHADHITPLADGGAHSVANLQPLCAPCHTIKTARENSTRARSAPEQQQEQQEQQKKQTVCLTDKCTAAFAVWRARNESFRVVRYERIAGMRLDDIARNKVLVTKTRNAQREAPYNSADLTYDLRYGYVVLQT
ncbi:MAG: HNH endonuclease [Gammaproteobacteria bacterium]|nr:HNH endonuclease [Gammaproteobacteria bacterium]